MSAAIAVGHQGPRDSGNCMGKRREFLLFKHCMQTLERDPPWKGPITFNRFQLVQQFLDNPVHGGVRIAPFSHHQARRCIFQFAPTVIPQLRRGIMRGQVTWPAATNR